MKHTKEPWKTYKGNTHEIFANDGDVIASSEECHIGHREAEANAKRIVACVNACAGITNEALEAGVVACGVNSLRDNIPEGNDQFYFDNVKVFEEDV